MNLLEIARELEAMAQTGLHFTKDTYDKERYERLRAISTSLLAEHSQLAPEAIHAWSAAEFGYATPKVDTRAVIVQEEQVLLIREDADGGRWTLPGGWADVNDTPSSAIAREVKEECGYEVEVKQLLAVLDREKQGHEPPFPYHIYKLFFHCVITGGEAVATSESSESRFFPVTDLPELSVSRVKAKQIQRFHAAITSGNPATEFD